MKTMKKFLLAVILTCGIHTQAQVISTVDCDMMDLSVASQDTGYVNLYHPGHYLTHPQSENYIAWTITDTQGNIIAQDTILDDAHYLFNHNIPITDTMNVIAHLWNDSAVMPNGNLVHCLIEDQLYWEVTQFTPTISIGGWNILNGNVGVDMNTSLGIDDITLDNKKLVKLVDFLGRETKQANVPLFYIYNDGTVEKRIVIE